MPHLRGSLVSKPTPHTLAITGSDFLWPISLTPIMAAADRVSLHPIHSGTRNPGLALSKGCHPGQSEPATASEAAPSLSRFEHVPPLQLAVYAVIFRRRIRHKFFWTERTVPLEDSATIPVLYGITKMVSLSLSSISPLYGSHVLTARGTLAG
ncbi:hypothetical protein V8C26DRAFT_423709 [Trichoderma gracile]